MTFSGEERREVREVINAERRSEDHWTFDKRIPLALIFVIITSIFGFGIWTANLSNRVTVVETATLDGFVSKEWAMGEHALIVNEQKHNINTASSIKMTIRRLETKMNKIYELLLHHNQPADRFNVYGSPNAGMSGAGSTGP